jgi:hypothetical protein
METMKPLYTKQRLFCYYMARMDDPVEAALRAGYSAKAARGEAIRLLTRGDVQAEVERCRKEARENRSDVALAGLCRLAVGGTGDAARLVCRAERPDEKELAAMDLFAVSELRRGKDDALEIKMYDRLKALELLLDYHSKEQEAEGGSIYSALGAAATGAGGEDHAV